MAKRKTKKPASRAAAKSRTATKKTAQKKSSARKVAAKPTARRKLKSKGRAAAPVKRARPKQRVAISHYRDADFKADGLRTYAKYRDLGVAARIPSLTWTVIVEQPTREAYAGAIVQPGAPHGRGLGRCVIAPEEQRAVA